MSKMALVQQPSALEGVRSWTIETIGHRGSETLVAYSPDGRWLATSCSDETIRLWDAATGAFVRAIVAHDRSISGICWSPDGTILASASGDRTVRLWEPESGRRLLTLQGEQGFGPVAWSPDGRRLAAAMPSALSGGTQIWEFTGADPRYATGRREGWQQVARGVITRVIRPRHIVTLVWCNDGNTLICGASSSGAYLCNVQSGEFRILLKGNQNYAGNIALSPDGMTLASTSDPVTLWNLDTGQLVREFPSDVRADRCLAWSPDGSLLAGGSYYYHSGLRKLCVCEPDTGEVRYRAVSRWDEWAVRSVSFSPDSKMLAAGHYSGRAQVWEARSGVEVGALPRHQGARLAVTWSANGDALACTPEGAPLKAQVLESISGKVLRESPGAHVVVTGIRLSRDTGLVEIGSGYGVRVWHVESGKETSLRSPTKSEVGSFAASLDGKTVVTITYKGTGEVWAVGAGEPKLTATLPIKIKAAALSADGKALAAGSGREVKISDPHTGQVKQTLPTAGAAISTLS